MKIDTITIHNFRSIADMTINVQDYSILLGANNSGKTTILSALRTFYEDIKFEKDNDFPKFSVDDGESWIEIKFKLPDDEFTLLKQEYKEKENTFRVRKYLRSNNKDLVQAGQSNIYGYEKGTLSTTQFYGAKNISQAKLGKVIYIPEVAQTSETMKFSGPSPLRDMINFVVKKVVEKSASFLQLTDSFNEFNKKFKCEQSNEGLSIESLIEQINESLNEWKMKFGLNINPIEPENIVKNLVTHHLIDLRLNEEVYLKNTGQGMQRHLIFTLLLLSYDYVDKKKAKKTDFSPDFTLLLFEEPEAFLHPCQQESLNRSLWALANEAEQQIVISTHSPIFVSKNIENLPMLIRLSKSDDGKSEIHQISRTAVGQLTDENEKDFVTFLKNKEKDPKTTQKVKDKINARLGSADPIKQIEEESMRYALWLDPTRCSSFFADVVLICEGATERIFIEYLIENKWKSLNNKRACILDTMGKYNVHRYMNLFKELGIYHSVLVDLDEIDSLEYALNEFLESKRNPYTKNIEYLDHDVESFLGIKPPHQSSTDKKPLNVMWNYSKNNISETKLEALRVKVQNLLS